MLNLLLTNFLAALAFSFRPPLHKFFADATDLILDGLGCVRRKSQEASQVNFIC